MTSESMPRSYWRDVELRARVVAAIPRLVIELVFLNHMTGR